MPAARLRLVTHSPEETSRLGRSLGQALSGGETILLQGPLGVGKTVLVQGIGMGIGYEGRVQSPSFVLERIHQGRLTLRHLDLYRLTGDEAWEAGLLEEPDSSTVVVVEWAQRAEGLLSWTMRIDLEYVSSAVDQRRITIEPADSVWREKANDVLKRFKESRTQSSGR